jgi:hypothetical protein
MFKSLHDILKEISELKTPKEKIEAIQSNRYREAIKTIFGYTYSPTIKWLLPEGNPPYKPCEYLDLEGRFLVELRKLYLYIEGGNPNLTTLRRETLFVQLLESIDPKDAKLLLAMKDRTLPFKGLNKKIANQAFPELNLE